MSYLFASFSVLHCLHVFKKYFLSLFIVYCVYMLCAGQDKSLESVLRVPGWDSGSSFDDKCFQLLKPSDCPIVRVSVTLGHCLSTHWLSNTRFCVLLPYLIFTNPTILVIGYRALHMLGQASYNQTKFPGYYLIFFSDERKV